DALDGGDCVCVEAQLQDVGGLLRSRELGVDGFVAPGSQRGRLVDALQEVGAAAPVALNEGRLVDDFGAGAHSFLGGAGGGGEVPGVGAQDAHDLATLGVERFQIGGFVLFALTTDEVGVVLGDVGTFEVAAGDFEGQRGEVRTDGVVVEVG